MAFSNNVKLILLVVLVVLLIVMLNNNDNQTQQKQQQAQQDQQLQVSNPSIVEAFDQQATQQASVTPVAQQQATQQQQVTSTGTSTTSQNMAALAQENADNQITFSCADYLPQDTSQDWFETDLTDAQISCDDANLITTDRYILGVDTVSNSLKNASHDLRGSLPVPKINVGPFLNSSIGPDFNIKQLPEITGQC